MKRLFLALFMVSVTAVALSAAMRGREQGSRLQQTRISTFANTTCAVLDDGTARCWGANDEGQVGKETRTASEPLPAVVSSISSIVSIAVGGRHACAIANGGAVGFVVYCWGDNTWGQLGDGTTTDRSTPVLVQGLTNPIAITAGEDHTCAIMVDGTARCWGANSNGRLGTGSVNSYQTSPQAVQGLTGVIAMAAGAQQTCAVVALGAVYCWGSGAVGSYVGRYTAVPVVVDQVNGAVAVAAGGHSCALLVDGTVKCWGNNSNGQLGNGGDSGSLTAVPVSQLANAVGISAGRNHTCALIADGTARCWGDNTGGKVGDGTTTARSVPAAAVINLANAMEIATGGDHTCSVQANGTVHCWGSNGVGQLGNGTTASSATATTVSNIAGSIAARGLVSGSGFTCARRGNGAVACWGSDADGKLGNGSAQGSSSNPTLVSGLAGTALLSAGVNHACALTANGSVRCWGGNAGGQLGVGDYQPRQSPVAAGGIANAVSIATGLLYSCALNANGAVFCWGSNAHGNLGNGTQDDSLTPVAVQSLSAIKAISVGFRHTCALRADGTVWCWGDNANANLGIGTAQSLSTAPVAVPGVMDAVAVSTTAAHTCALLASGTAKCWGANFYGTIGNTTTATAQFPETVSGLTDAVGISAGFSHTCAVQAFGRASCWGNNQEGQLAAATLSDYYSPTPVIRTFANGTVPTPQGTVIAISASPGSARRHTCALRGNGQPICWGENLDGQVGISDSADQLRPVNVPSFTANIDTAGDLRSNGRIAAVTALVNCEAGAQAQIFVTLTQGAVVGSGVASERCTGGMARVPVVVPAAGPNGFVADQVTASLESIVREKGSVIDQQRWTRQVTLAVQ